MDLPEGIIGAVLIFLCFKSEASWIKKKQATVTSVRNRETISPDQFCPMTSRARLSTSCSYTSLGDVHSLSVH